jgi:hypothetical protein
LFVEKTCFILKKVKKLKFDIGPPF